MYFIDEIIDFINKNVDSWVLATLILLWAIILHKPREKNNLLHRLTFLLHS